MGKGAAGKQQVVDYSMSIHFRIASATMDELLAIYIGEKEAWTGSVITETDITINQPFLFGGTKKEGGTVGVVRYLPGGPTQVMPEHLAQRLGLTTATCPGYRGMASIFFTGDGSLYGGAGFLWGSNNPYLKTVWAKVRRRSVGLDPTIAMIPQGGQSFATNRNVVTIDGVSATVQQGSLSYINGAAVLLDGKSLTINGIEIIADLDTFTLSVAGLSASMGDGVTTIGNYTVATPSSYVVGSERIANLSITTAAGAFDSNPMHIIYECMVNTDWGEGGAPTGIDKASFEACARTLYNERLGLSLMWTKQTDIESFVQEVADHIQATLFVHPRTGLMTAKLIRGDYTLDELPILNADNATIISFDRKGLGETINEIVATWTNPENEKEETITAQNNANIAVQGGIISDSRNYYAARTVDLAQRLAFRDLRTASAPLASYEIEADRSAWDFIPGGCARLQFPEYGFDNVVIRLSKIDYGKPGQPSIKLSALEDIFALTAAEFDEADQSQWSDESADPSAPAFSRLITAPAFFVARTLTASDASMLSYPEVLGAVLASQDNNDTFSYELYGIDTLPNGEVVAELTTTRPMLAHCLLPANLPAATTTLLPTFGPVIGGPQPQPGGFLFIGNVSERAQEIALIQSFDANGWVLKRGVLDTVPRAWPAGSVAWFVSGDSRFVLEDLIYSEGETVSVKIAPITSRGSLGFDTAPLLATTLTARPHLPLRPGNVTVAGAAFGVVDLSAAPPVPVTVTWANRNRLLEDSQVLGWDAGNVVPETGQTTLVRVFDTAGVQLAAHGGLSGTTFDIPAESFGTADVADVVVSSQRDGFDSLQAHRIRLKLGVDGDTTPPPPEPVDPDPTPDPDFPTVPPWRPGGVYERGQQEP